MRPETDPELLAIVGPRPNGAVFCDQCMRWESGDGDVVHVRPELTRNAKKALALAAKHEKIASGHLRRCQLIQAKYLVKKGLGHSTGQPRRSK